MKTSKGEKKAMKWVARCILDNGPALDIPVVDEERRRIVDAAKKRKNYELIKDEEVMFIDFKHLRTFSLSQYIPPPAKVDNIEKCVGD